MAAVSTVSKKRYQEIADVIANYLGDPDKTEHVMAEIRAILKFDPNQPQYTPEKGRKVREQHKVIAAQTGQSLYVVAGIKNAYDKRKANKANSMVAVA